MTLPPDHHLPFVVAIAQARRRGHHLNLSVLPKPRAADNPREKRPRRPGVVEYKLPVEITILDDLPKNAVGKIAKPALRQRLASTH